MCNFREFDFWQSNEYLSVCWEHFLVVVKDCKILWKIPGASLTLFDSWNEEDAWQAHNVQFFSNLWFFWCEINFQEKQLFGVSQNLLEFCSEMAPDPERRRRRRPNDPKLMSFQFFDSLCVNDILCGIRNF